MQQIGHMQKENTTWEFKINIIMEHKNTMKI